MMRKVTINGDGELYVIGTSEGNSHIDYSRIATSEFLDSASRKYSSYCDLSDYSNEIFINYFVRKHEWRALIQDGDSLIKAENNSIYHSIWNEVVENTSKYREDSFKTWLVFSWLKLFLAYFSCFVIIIMRKLKTFGCNYNSPLNKIAIVRSKATFKKLSSVAEHLSITLISEDIVYKNRNIKSLFSILSFRQCLKALFKTISPAIKEFGHLIEELETVFGPRVSTDLICSYSSRVVLKCTFEQLLIVLIEDNNVSELVTGNKEDRFAMVEKRLCKKYKIPLTCIPHGLEYAYRFPSGIAGDLFYCTSNTAKIALSALYPMTQFVYEESLQRLMYRHAKKSSFENHQHKKIVFFTESRDIEVNRKIIDELIAMGLDFYVRLHPKDSEKNYFDKNIRFQESYCDAISNSICICRKSTVLIEALYNDSTPIAYLINSKDKYYVSQVFPSLSSIHIHKCIDKKSLALLIYAP